jgi:ATP-dependent Clp protease, protease subunit
VKVKVLLRVKDAKGNIRCEVKQNADTGILRIVGEIDWWKNSSDNFRVALDTMKQSGITKLKAYVNSPGGSVHEANEIYNLIVAFCSEENRSLDIGAMCASAATTIAGAFPQKNTRAYQNVTWMMHNCQIGVYGEKKDLISYAKLLENLENTYRKNWAKRMGISETFLKNKMDETWWLTAEELIKYNIASSIIDDNDSVPTDTRQVLNKLDVKEFPSVLNKVLPPEEEKKPEPVTKTNTMKNLILLLMASMGAFVKNYLSGKEDATEAEMVAALTKAWNDKDNKITELTNSITAKDTEITTLKAQVKKHNEDMIKALLDVAEKTEKKITAEARKVYEEQAPILGFDGLSKILAAIPARKSVKDSLENGNTNPAAGGKGKDDEREEPQFTKDENGGRVYDKPSNQQAVLQRMMIEQSKQK